MWLKRFSALRDSLLSELLQCSWKTTPLCFKGVTWGIFSSEKHEAYWRLIYLPSETDLAVLLGSMMGCRDRHSYFNIKFRHLYTMLELLMWLQHKCTFGCSWEWRTVLQTFILPHSCNSHYPCEARDCLCNILFHTRQEVPSVKAT